MHVYYNTYKSKPTAVGCTMNTHRLITGDLLIFNTVGLRLIETTFLERQLL